jgi:hypothetical protein
MARHHDSAVERERDDRRRDAPDRTVRWAARIFLLILIVIGLLILMNNTPEGLAFKCHVLGDLGACFLVR